MLHPSVKMVSYAKWEQTVKIDKRCTGCSRVRDYCGEAIVRGKMHERRRDEDDIYIRRWKLITKPTTSRAIRQPRPNHRHMPYVSIPRIWSSLEARRKKPSSGSFSATPLQDVDPRTHRASPCRREIVQRLPRVNKAPPRLGESPLSYLRYV